MESDHSQTPRHHWISSELSHFILSSMVYNRVLDATWSHFTSPGLTSCNSGNWKDSTCIVYDREQALAPTIATGTLFTASVKEHVPWTEDTNRSSKLDNEEDDD